MALFPVGMCLPLCLILCATLQTAAISNYFQEQTDLRYCVILSIFKTKMLNL